MHDIPFSTSVDTLLLMVVAGNPPAPYPPSLVKVGYRLP